MFSLSLNFYSRLFLYFKDLSLYWLHSNLKLTVAVLLQCLACVFTLLEERFHFLQPALVKNCVQDFYHLIYQMCLTRSSSGAHQRWL